MANIEPKTNGYTQGTLKPHELCDPCKSFWERAACLQTQPGALPGADEERVEMPQYLRFSPQPADVLSAASLGCHFCSIVVGAAMGCTALDRNTGLPAHGNRQFGNATDDDPIFVAINVLDPDIGSFLLTVFRCDPDDELGIQILNDSRLIVRPIFEGPETEEAASLVSRLFFSSRLETTTFSPATANFIKEWIFDCRNSHIICGDDHLRLLSESVVISALPRRVLDLQAFQDLERIRLVEVGDSSISTWDQLEYCAMSYSWGHGDRYLMTSSNIATFRAGLHIGVLPNLLQDVIQVARGIGLRYLWIDALCIMQDGSEQNKTASDDWEDQAGKMGDIFGNAVVTIAASECFDATASLIRPRNPLSQLTCRLDANTKLQYEIIPSCTPSCERHPFDNARYHIDTRAWVFQERILSPRTIHLTRNFVHLECRTELRCGAMDGAEACHHSGAVAKAEYHTLFSMFGPDGLYDFAVGGFLSFWHGIIGRYSTTDLSRKPQLLVALAGLATQIQMKGKLTWTFGLWQEHFLQDMLWYVRGGTGTLHSETAPTWSWANIEVKDGPKITYEPSIDVSPLAEIQTLPDASNPARRGPLAAGTNQCVKISGRLRPGAPDSATYGRDHREMRIHRNCQGLQHLVSGCTEPQHIHRQCPFHPDYDLSANTELYSLLVGCVAGPRIRTDTWKTHVGLVLTPVAGHQGRYHRVGYFHMDVQGEMEGENQRIPWILQESRLAEIEII